MYVMTVVRFITTIIRGLFFAVIVVVAAAAETVATDGPASADKNTKTMQQKKPPNIVIMLADNLGYEDVSWFAAVKHNRTPNIDSLGADGLTFTHWNSAAHLCSASRAALLTGQYPARTGIYPGVFHPDAALGLSASSTTTSKTIAQYLKEEAYGGYATSCIGKWHLGHRKQFLPMQHGFDEWLGIPYHMSGGSVDNHTCVYDINEIQWLPLYQNDTIVQQPVRINELAAKYADAASDFIQRHASSSLAASNSRNKPFFLYMAFSHVHQLCASANDVPEQTTCQWAAAAIKNNTTSHATFADAVTEMDWIAGQILSALDRAGVRNDTLVIFTSDNGPWVAEQSCAGLKGPFAGQWCVFVCTNV